MLPSSQHRNFDEHNDVVLDKIIEINKLDVDKYPKLYDVTVPSTVNFALANSLVVRDTAETGFYKPENPKNIVLINIRKNIKILFNDMFKQCKRLQIMRFW
jgi:hypothetical protein